MQLTLTSDYAARVLIYLATLPPGARRNRDELAEAGQVPVHFLGKILQALARAGLIVSQRGMAGGFSLARPAEQLTLLDVVEAVEGPLALNRCLSAATPCSRQAWCAAHALWARAQRALADVLRSSSILELARQTRAGNSRELCALQSAQTEACRWS